MRIFFGILIILAAFNAKAELTCSQLFNDFAPTSETLIQAVFPAPKLMPLNFLERGKKVSQPSVEIKGTILDENGNSLHVFQKKESLPWYSLHKTGENDPQGDPRNFAMVLGPKVAYDFGFRYISDTQMTAPTAAALNFYIRLMNIKLKLMGKELIGITFYETAETVTDAEYLRRFAYFGELPLTLEIHDGSYHTLAILLQNNLTAPAMKTGRFILELQTSLEMDPLLSSQEKDITAKFMDGLIQRAVRDIDLGTGNLAAFQTNLKETVSDNVFSISFSHLQNLPELLGRPSLLSDLRQEAQNNLYHRSEKLHEALVRNYTLLAFKFFNENSRDKTIFKVGSALLNKYKAWAKENPVMMNQLNQYQMMDQLENRIRIFQRLSEEDSN